MIIRRIDDLGRIVIPRELRHNLNIKIGDAFSINVINGDIIIKKATSHCTFCNSEIENGLDREYSNLCDKCVEKLKS